MLLADQWMECQETPPSFLSVGLRVSESRSCSVWRREGLRGLTAQVGVMKMEGVTNYPIGHGEAIQRPGTPSDVWQCGMGNCLVFRGPSERLANLAYSRSFLAISVTITTGCRGVSI